MSLMLAKLFGLYFLVLGFSFIFTPDRFRRMYQQVAKDENFLLLGGMLALLIGAFVISVHNEWEWSWPVIITILGWWSFIKGAALLIYPKSIGYFAFIQNRSDMFYQIISICWLILGAFLLYKGICHHHPGLMMHLENMVR